MKAKNGIIGWTLDDGESVEFVLETDYPIHITPYKPLSSPHTLWRVEMAGKTIIVTPLRVDIQYKGITIVIFGANHYHFEEIEERLGVRFVQAF